MGDIQVNAWSSLETVLPCTATIVNPEPLLFSFEGPRLVRLAAGRTRQAGAERPVELMDGGAYSSDG